MICGVDATVLVIFALVYLGMFLGELPGLALDRTGIALLGAIALLVSGRLAPEEMAQAVDVSTLALLFAFMVISTQLRLGGFYTFVTQRIAAARVSSDAFLALLVAVAGVLSALLANDIVCLAMAPVLAQGCVARGRDPVPHLIALACAANVGSAATLIGNPQNMLIGQALGLSFARFLLWAAPPALAGLGVIWWLLRGGCAAPARAPLAHAAAGRTFDRWQTTKGLLVLATVVACFLFTPWRREVVALAGAGLLLTSRRLASRELLGLVDWELLVLFAGLFIVNHAVEGTGAVAQALSALREAGLDLAHPGWLFPATVVLSNLVSNVPATMLLLPAATHALAGPVLALASTLAGNLLLVGSIANLIVADQAADLGIRIDWRAHARAGVPVTVATLGLAAAWLALLATLGAAP
jgi:Na+/H+ antiporter NhaD/arsenite permease-like protein